MPKHLPKLKVMEPPQIKGPVSEHLTCWKIPFASKEDAESFEPSQYGYKCNLCQRWHLTSHRPKRGI